MHLKNRDLVGAMLLVIINVGLAVFPDCPLVLRIIFGLPLALVLPGYMLTQLLFHWRSLDPSGHLILEPKLKIGRPVGGADYIILSLGLSLATDIMAGFMLNIFPVGLQARSWAISLGLVVTVCALLTAYLRRNHPVQVGKTFWPRIAIYEYILFGLSIVVAIGAVWSSTLRPLQPQPSFTQFWMLPSSQANNSCAVLVGLQSYETAPVTYRVVVQVNGSQVGSWPSVVLLPRGKWNRSISIKPGTAALIDIEAQLYRTDKLQSMYRNAHLTMHSVKGDRNGPAQQCTS